MNFDYSAATIAELRTRVVEAGDRLLTADEEGGVAGDTAWDDAIHAALRELLRRGKEGEDVISSLCGHSNAEVVLAAASAALASNVDVTKAKRALEELRVSRVGSGWPAHYAQKVLGRYR